MKVLDPKQIKQGKELENQRDASRTEDTRKALSSVQSKLDDAEARFDVALKNQRVRWESEEKEATDKIFSLQTEVRSLEIERKSLLIPIDAEADRAHNLLKEAEKALSDAEKTKSDNEAVSELLQEKLDDVSSRELDAKDEETRLDTRDKLVKDHELKVSALSKDLSAKWEEFFAQKSISEAESKKKQREFELREMAIKNREDSIDAKNMVVVEKERLVNDRYATLLRTEKRLKQ